MGMDMKKTCPSHVDLIEWKQNRIIQHAAGDFAPMPRCKPLPRRMKVTTKNNSHNKLNMNPFCHVQIVQFSTLQIGFNPPLKERQGHMVFFCI